jgi:autotransporter translocation and assembly factor TamB
MAAVITALAAAAYFSGALHAAFRRGAEDYLARRTGVEWGIGKLGGDLFTGLDVSGVYIANGSSLKEDGPAIAAEEVHIRYDLPALLRGVLLIKKARVVDPYVMVRVEPDGRTNLERIFSFTSGRGETNLVVRLDDVTLENGTFEWGGDGPVDTVERINIRSSLEFAGGESTFALGDCSCYLPAYDLAVASFGTGELKITRDGLLVDGVDLALDETSLTVDGEIETAPATRYDLTVKAEPLSLTEVLPLFAPDAPPLDVRGRYEGTLRGPGDNLVHTGAFYCPSGTVADVDLDALTVRYAVDLEPKLVRVEKVSGSVNGLPAYLSGTVDLAGEVPAFRGEGRLERFDLARLIPESGVETGMDVTASFEGRGSSAEDVELTATVAAGAGFAGPVRFDGAVADLRYAGSQFFVDDAAVRFGPGTVSAAGTLTRDNVELAITAEAVPLAELPTEKFPLDVAGTLGADVRVYGELQRPSVDGEVTVAGLEVEGVTAAWARLEGSAERAGTRKADLYLTAGDVAVGPFLFERSRADMIYDGRILTLGGAFESDEAAADRVHFDVWHDSSSGDWELSRLDAKLGNAWGTLTEPLYVEREGRRYAITRGTLSLLRGDISFSGSFDLRGGPVDVVAAGDDFRLDGLKLWPAAPELTGSLNSIKVGVRGTADAPGFYVILDAHDFSVGGQPVDLLRGEVSLEDKRVVVPDLTLKLGGGTATATADFPLAALEGEGNAPLQGEVRFTRFPLSSVVALNEAGLSEGAYVDGTLTLAGTGAAPVVRAEFDVADAVWDNVRYNRGRLDVSYDNGEVDLRELSLGGGASRNANVSGTAEVAFAEEAGLVLGALALRGEFDGLDLRVLNPLLSEVLIVGGTLSGKVDVGGTASSPVLAGRLEVAGGAGTVRPLRSTLSELGGVIDLDDNVAVVSSEAPLTFELDSGRGFVWGSIEFEGGQPAAVDASLTLEGYTLRAVTGVRILTDVTASLSGPAKHPHADVDVYVRRGVVATDFGGAVYSPESEQGPLDFRVHVDAPGNLWLRNKMAEIELEADLTVRKTGPATTITGELTAKRGSVFFLARDFVIEQGDIYFTGTQSFDPVLKLKAKRLIRATRPGNADAEIIIDVTGTFTEPEFWFSYRSRGGGAAGLSQNQITQLLVLDVTYEDFQDMSGGSLASKGSSDYVRRLAQAEVSRTVRKKTGLDVFEYDASGIGADRGARYRRATLGKYVGSDVFLSYTAEYSEDVTGAGGQEHSAEINYRLYEDFYLVGSTFEEEEHQQYGLGLRFFFKY